LQKQANTVIVNPDSWLRHLCMYEYYLQSRAAGHSPERGRFVSRLSWWTGWRFYKTEGENNLS